MLPTLETCLLEVHRTRAKGRGGHSRRIDKIDNKASHEDACGRYRQLPRPTSKACIKRMNLAMRQGGEAGGQQRKPSDEEVTLAGFTMGHADGALELRFERNCRPVQDRVLTGISGLIAHGEETLDCKLMTDDTKGSSVFTTLRSRSRSGAARKRTHQR